MKVALVQTNPTIGDFDRNLDAVRRGLDRAAAEGAELAVTCEMSLVGYPPVDLVERPGFVDAAAAQRGSATAPQLPRCSGWDSPGF